MSSALNVAAVFDDASRPLVSTEAIVADVEPRLNLDQAQTRQGSANA